MLAYAVGFGGSMIWFGSSAGVAISNLFPEVRSVGAWVKEGWLTAVAYVVGFVVLLMLLGWHPAPKLLLNTVHPVAESCRSTTSRPTHDCFFKENPANRISALFSGPTRSADRFCAVSFSMS
jgi:hypothetical protein